MSELDEMRVFVHLVEEGSATRAAEKLGLANSAVSRRMKELEARLGASLVHRTTRRMHVTDTGRLFYERCKRILGDLDEALEAASAGASEPSGNLRIAAPLSFGISHLAPVIVDFMQRYPRITVDVDMTDRRVDIVRDGFDVAVRVGKLEDSTLIARRLSGLNHVVACSPEFLDAHGPFEAPEQLRGLPALCYSNLPSPERWIFTDAGGEGGEVRVAPRLYSTNGDVLCLAAAGGLGLVCEPSFIVAPAIRAGSLVPALTDWRWFGMELYAIYPFTRHLSGRVRSFVDFLLERLGDDFLQKQTRPLLHDPTYSV